MMTRGVESTRPTGRRARLGQVRRRPISRAGRAAAVTIVIGILTAAAGVTFPLWDRISGSPAPDFSPKVALALAAVSVDQPATIDGFVTLDDFAREQGVTDDSPAVDANSYDVTLRNSGDAPALVTGLALNVEAQPPMTACTDAGGGKVYVDASYDFRLPRVLPEGRSEYTKEVRFEVPPNSISRLTVTLGSPDAQRGLIQQQLFTAELRLEVDQGDALDIGAAGFAGPVESFDDFAFAELDAMSLNPACVDENRQRVSDFVDQTSRPSYFLLMLERSYGTVSP